MAGPSRSMCEMMETRIVTMNPVEMGQRHGVWVAVL
jgi:hypothetical protein